MNVSCLQMMYSENFWDPLIYRADARPYDPNISMWRVPSNKTLLYLQVLRIFYVVGDPKPVQIGDIHECRVVVS